MIDVGVLLGDPRLPYDYAPGGVFGDEELRAVERLKVALDTLEGYRFTYFDDHDVVLDALREARPQLVLNLCDTGFRNQWDRELELPALLITERSVVRSDAEARETLAWLADELDRPEVLAQEYLPGREYTVGVIGNPGEGFDVLPALEVDFGALDEGLPPILTHGSKADPSSPYWTQLTFRRAELDEDTREELAESCARVFERLAFRDYARFDFREGEDGRPRLIDANINPTWYEGGKLSLMAGWAGHDYAAMMRLILEAAAARYGIAR